MIGYTTTTGIKNIIQGYNTTVTNGGDLVLEFGSDNIQYFTGDNTHNVILPVVSTLVIGQQYTIINSSTHDIYIKSSGLNVICIVHTNNAVKVMCVSMSGTDESAWNYNVSTDATALYFSAYNDGVDVIDINNTWTDIPWSSTDIVDPNFTFTPGSSILQVSRSGDYEIQVDLTLFVSSRTGTARTQVESRMLKNGVYLPGTKSLIDIQDVGSGSTSNLKIIKPLSENDTLTVQCIKQGGNRVIRIYPDGCRIVVQRLSK